MNDYTSRTMKAAFQAREPETQKNDSLADQFFYVADGEQPMLDVSALQAEIASLPQNRFLNPAYWPKG